MRNVILVLGAVVVLILLTILSRWDDDLIDVSRRVEKKLGRDIHLVASPAPLFPAHRDEKDLQDCSACHTLASSIPSSRCLVCHDEIQERLASHTGYHGTQLTGECVSCHTEHAQEIIQFDRDSFGHSLATFDLEGSHAELKCERCHERPREDGTGNDFRYLGIPHDRCQDCHDDPHQGRLTAQGRDCLFCHDQNKWGGRHLSFSHERDSDFALEGAHNALDCEECHVPPTPKSPLGAAMFKGVSRRCADCHDDVHGGQFEQERCDRCHRQESFDRSDLRFHHADFRPFPLLGAHAAVACNQCHRPMEGTEIPHFRGVGKECASCHEDPHRGSLAEADCTRCHDAVSWQAGRFDHNTMTDFPLDKVHRPLACAQCHDSKVYRPTPTTCAACHQEQAELMAGRARIGKERENWRPSPHQGVVRCVDCHDMSQPRQTAVSYAHRCTSCHTERYAALFFERTAHITQLGQQVADERMGALIRAASHNYVEAERRVRAVLKEVGGIR